MSEKKEPDDRLPHIREALRDRVFSKVASATGLHINTVRNVAKKPEQNFAPRTVGVLFRYLFGEGI